VDRHPTAARLVDTASDLVDRQGHESLTVRALVEASGVSVGSVYHHLNSIDEVLAVVATRALEAWAASFLGALRRRGYAAACAADRTWARAHPGLSALVVPGGALRSEAPQIDGAPDGLGTA